MSVDPYAWWLRSPESRAAVWGDVSWAPKPGSTCWQADCGGLVADGSEVLLRLIFRPLRQDEPTVLFRCNGWAWRIDHNGPHRGTYRTHVQLEGTDHYELIDPAKVATPQRGLRVDVSELEVILRKSAAYLGVDAGGVVWLDPPREVE